MSNRTPATLATTLTLAALAAIFSAAVAQAAPTAPALTTGAATAVSYSGAVLSGTVDPHGAGTSYYFQFGLTRAYGAQTAVASAGDGTTAVQVSAPISGLQPAVRATTTGSWR